MVAKSLLSLQESLYTGCSFGHTNTDNAKGRLKRRVDAGVSTVNVAVISDDDVDQTKSVCRALISALKDIEDKDEITISTGNVTTADKIVQKFAAKSNIESYEFNISEVDNWLSESTPWQEMVEKIIDFCDVVIFLTSGHRLSKSISYAYNYAVVEGCLVTRKIIKKA